MSKQNSGTVWAMTKFAQAITLIGAGGKTTTLQMLTKEIQAYGKNVIATTTTKVYPMHFNGVWRDEAFPPPQDSKYPCFWYARTVESATKWEGPTVEVVDQALKLSQLSKRNQENRSEVSEKNLQEDRIRVRETSDKALSEVFWVIEGDGAREKKLKCWDSHEPQIPFKSECAILVIPRGIWGKVLTDKDIHRSEKCPSFVGETWDDEKCARYILNSPVFYPRYRNLFWIVLFNEVELSPKGSDNPLQFNIRQFFYRQALSDSSRPSHLRIASGNVKVGTLRWYDMW